jgi:hypothetical protein
MADESFIIGNGKTAKVGDKVWDSNSARVLERMVVALPAYKGWAPHLDAGRAVASELFATREEAIAHRIATREEHITRTERSLAKARAEVAKLKAMLEKAEVTP